MTNRVCKDLAAQDSGVYDHCREWLPSDVRSKNVDEGVTNISYERGRFEPTIVLVDSEDGVTTPEYLQWVLDTVDANPEANLALAEDLFVHTGIRIPYLFTDYDPNTHEDELTRQNILQWMAGAKTRAMEKAREAGQTSTESREYRVALSQEIIQFVEKLAIYGQAYAPTKNAFEALTADSLQCVGFSNLYYGLALLAGLHPRFELVHRVAGLTREQQAANVLENGKETNHVRVTVPLEQGQPIEQDFAFDGRFGLMGQQPAGEAPVELSNRDFVARYYTNLYRASLGLKYPPGNQTFHEGDAYWEIANKLAPNDFSVIETGIRYWEWQGNMEKATEFFIRAQRARPFSSDYLKQKYPKEYQQFKAALRQEPLE